MEDLIKALQIFLKYKNSNYPFNCTHDELVIWDITPDEVSSEDKAELEKLGFEINEDEEYFYSFRYGSCWKIKINNKDNKAMHSDQKDSARTP